MTFIHTPKGFTASYNSFSEYNDEFESNELDASWVWSDDTNSTFTPSASAIDVYSDTTGGGAVTNTRYSLQARPSFLMVQPSNGGASVLLTKSITVPTNFLIWARCTFRTNISGAINNDIKVGIVIGADASGVMDDDNRVGMYLQESDNNDRHIRSDYFTSGTFNLIQDGGNIGNEDLQAFDTVAIHKLGTTYHFWAGNNSHWMYMSSITLGFTATWAGLLFAGGVINDKPGTPLCGVDYFRALETTEFIL